MMELKENLIKGFYWMKDAKTRTMHAFSVTDYCKGDLVLFSRRLLIMKKELEAAVDMMGYSELFNDEELDTYYSICNTWEEDMQDAYNLPDVTLRDIK